METLKKWLTFGLIVVMLLSLAACDSVGSPESDSSGAVASGESQGSSAENGAADKIKVATVFASSGLGDKSFNDSLMDGLNEAVDELGVELDYSVPKDDAEIEPLLRGYSDAGDYDLIISMGFSSGTSLESVAPNYPEQNYLLLDTSIDSDNVAGYFFRDEELAFMVGVMAGMLTETNTLGFIGSFDIPFVNASVAGMMAGIQYVNPEAKLLVDYVGGWAEVTGCKEMALAMHSQGADVFYHGASAGGMGILEAGKEAGFLTFSFDGNLNADAPETNVAGAIRSFAGVAKRVISEVKEGKFSGGSFQEGASDGTIFLDFEGSSYNVPAEVMDAYEKAVKEIVNGKFTGEYTLPTDVESALNWQSPEY